MRDAAPRLAHSPGERSSVAVGSSPQRTKPRGEFYLTDNEVVDIFSPIIGPHAGTIYTALVRNSYCKSQVEYSVRDMAKSTGMSSATAARARQILEKVGLIRVLPTSGNRKSVCELIDVKALANSLGARYDRKARAWTLPQSAADALRADIEALRRDQQRKPRSVPIVRKSPDVEIASKTGFHSLSSIAQRDASVSHLIRQRSTRETQTRTHLLREEEERMKTILSPTPSQDGEMWKSKDLSNEDGPILDLLRWARAKFTGVMEDMRDHLLGINRRPMPHLTNGFEDWKTFGLESLYVERATEDEKALALVLAASDPAAAQRGLEKYDPTWERLLRKWFKCEVRVELGSSTAEMLNEGRKQLEGNRGVKFRARACQWPALALRAAEQGICSPGSWCASTRASRRALRAALSRCALQRALFVSFVLETHERARIGLGARLLRNVKVAASLRTRTRGRRRAHQ